METIVVATDFSSEANNAMVYAANLAHSTKARLILFNSYQLPDDKPKTSYAPAEIDKHLNENREYLQKMAKTVSERYSIPVDYWTNLTYVAEGLDELVRTYNASLVVMGMWKNAREDFMFGNTTTFVISQASYPVLVVPEGLLFVGISRILFSWDPHKLITAKTLKPLKELAASFDAQVQVFYVNQAPESPGFNPVKPNGALEQKLQGVRHAYRQLEERDILLGIERGVRDFEADLLVMVPQKLGVGEPLFHESRTQGMSLKTRVPLLSLPIIG